MQINLRGKIPTVFYKASSPFHQQALFSVSFSIFQTNYVYEMCGGDASRHNILRLLKFSHIGFRFQPSFAMDCYLGIREWFEGFLYLGATNGFEGEI